MAVRSGGSGGAPRPVGGVGNRTMAAAIDAHRHAGPVRGPVALGSVSGANSIQRQPKRKREDDGEGPVAKRRRLDDEGGWAPGGEDISMDYVEDKSVLDDLDSEETDEIEELIAMFERMSISFTSEADGEEHEIYPGLFVDDLIVESNPTPLKAIIATGTWLGVPLGAAVAQLTLLGQDAQAHMAAYGKSRSVGNADALRSTMRQVGHLLKHLTPATKTPLLKTDLSGSENYGNNGSAIEGTHLIADPLTVRSDTSGSKPKKDSRLTLAIRNRAKTAGQKAKNFKQMHLLNDNLFGPGLPWNLTAGTPKCNTKHEAEIEKPLKKAIYEKGLMLRYEAIVTYGMDPMAASDTDIKSKPDLYRFQRITFVAKEYTYDPLLNTFTLGAKPKDPHVKKVDGAVLHWNWGNTKQLVAKPKVLRSTDVNELVTVGIPNAAAVRIVAYNVANPKGHPSKTKGIKGTDKQAALISLVAAHDGKRRMSDKWKSTSVLWSL